MRVLLIQLHPVETPGRIGEYLSEKRIPFDLCHLYRGDLLPEASRYGAIIVFGCPSSVGDVMHEEWSRQLFFYLDEIAESPRPVPYLGVCFGAQIMAAHSGAAVLPNRPKEIGVYTVTLNERGMLDPLFRGFPSEFPVFHWHGDMFDTPMGGEITANGVDCVNQAFRHEKSWGVQFHVEMDPDSMAEWCDEYDPELVEVGKSARQLGEDYHRVEAETKRLCYLMMDNFLAEAAKSA